MAVTNEILRVILLANAVFAYAGNSQQSTYRVPSVNASPGIPIGHGVYPENFNPPPPKYAGKGMLYGMYVPILCICHLMPVAQVWVNTIFTGATFGKNTLLR